jgi:hypothetical protein
MGVLPWIADQPNDSIFPSLLFAARIKILVDEQHFPSSVDSSSTEPNPEENINITVRSPSII